MLWPTLTTFLCRATVMFELIEWIDSVSMIVAQDAVLMKDVIFYQNYGLAALVANGGIVPLVNSTCRAHATPIRTTAWFVSSWHVLRVFVNINFSQYVAEAVVVVPLLALCAFCMCTLTHYSTPFIRFVRVTN